MTDLIDRQAAIDALRKMQTYKMFSGDDMLLIDQAGAMTELMLLPPAEPERMRGKWIERNPQNSDKCRLIECDQCGFSHIVGFNVPYEHWIENRNFCERCGADMRGEHDG